MTQHYQVFARRFRPQTFAQVLGQEAIVTTMKNALTSNRLAHAYLFCGSRGTGKTSLARLFAKAMNCRHRGENAEPCNCCTSCKEITEGRSLDVIEIDGASYRGIDDMRAISDSVSYAPSLGMYKIYLIDEVHMLTKEAFNALLKTLEEPPEKVKFFFATTEPHKVLPTIMSRCQRFNLNRLSSHAICQKLSLIAQSCGIQVEEKALERIATYAEGGLRDAESMFDQLAAFSCSEKIDENVVQQVLALSPYEWFLQLDNAIVLLDYRVAFSLSQKLFSEGKDINYFILDLSQHYKNLLYTKLAGTEDIVSFSYEEKSKFLASALLPTLTEEDIIAILDIITKAHIALKSSASPQLLLEWLLVSIIQIKIKVPLPTVVKKLHELQNIFSSNAASYKPSGDTTVKHIETAKKDFVITQNISDLDLVCNATSPTTAIVASFEDIKEAGQKKLHNKLENESLISTLSALATGSSFDHKEQKDCSQTRNENEKKTPIEEKKAIFSSSTSSINSASTHNSARTQWPTATAPLQKEATSSYKVGINSKQSDDNFDSYITTSSVKPGESEGQEKARQDSIMQFASIELEGTLIKKTGRQP